MTNLNELVPDIKISVNQIKGPYFTPRLGEDFSLLLIVLFAFLQASKKLLPSAKYIVNAVEKAHPVP